MIKEKTTQQLMDDWLDALRSGEYNQIEGFLYTDEGKCCLGVLGCVADAPFDAAYDEPTVFALDEHIALLPPSYARRFGLDKMLTEDEEVKLSNMTGNVLNANRQTNLSHLNDNGYTFEQIADVVEQMGWNKVDDEW